MKPWKLTIPSGLNQELQEHLFPGDHDEHGAVILAGTCESERDLRLVARELHLAKDGVDYVPGKRGYRMLKAEFIQGLILRARDKRLAYLAIHNHGGTDTVGFSEPDMASHERGYPALLDIARGMPVGALVFARSAVAGDLWFPGSRRAPLSQAAIIGHRRELLFPKPEKRTAAVGMYDRQSRLFGDAGQELLRRTRVGIVGLGGAGSVLAELLGRLGVGEFVLADPDRAEETNLPRLIGARRRDAVLPAWLPSVFATRLRSTKVRMAARNIRRASPKAQIATLARDFLDDDVAERFTDCDFIFRSGHDGRAAAVQRNRAPIWDSGHPSRRQNPCRGRRDGRKRVLCRRMVTPEQGCLWCNGLINAGRLQDEAVPEIAVQRNRAPIWDSGHPSRRQNPCRGRRDGRKRVLCQPNGHARTGVPVVQRTYQCRQITGRGGPGDTSTFQHRPAGLRLCGRSGCRGAERGHHECGGMRPCRGRLPVPPHRSQERGRGDRMVPMELASRGGGL